MTVSRAKSSPSLTSARTTLSRNPPAVTSSTVNDTTRRGGWRAAWTTASAWSPIRTGFAIFGAALIVRLIWLVLWRNGLPLAFDGAEMEQIAINLAEGRGFSSPFPPYTAPTAWLAPLVPAIWWLVFEVTVRESQAFATVLFLQAIVSSLTVVMLWLVARRLAAQWGANVSRALVPALLLILWPASLTWLDGTWYTLWQELMLVVLVLAGMRWHDAPTLTHGVQLGAVAGVAALINPAPFPVAALAFLGPIVFRRQWSLPVLRAGVLGGCVSALIILPWTARNYRAFGEFIPVRGNLGIELRIANGPRGFVRTTAEAPHPWVDSVERARYNRLGEAAYASAGRDSAIAFMRGNPRRTALRAAARAYIFWFSDITDRWSWLGAGWRWWERDWRSTAVSLIRIACNLASMAIFLTAMWRLLTTHRRLPYLHLMVAVLVLMPLPNYLAPISESKGVFAQGWLLLIGLTVLASVAARRTERRDTDDPVPRAA